MYEWQPIETAPKDGSRILVFTVNGEVELSEWYQTTSILYAEAGDGLYRRVETPMYEGWNSNTPTHWMPLPDPPKADAEQR